MSAARRPIHLRPWAPGDERAFVPRLDFQREALRVGWDWARGAPGPTWTLVRWPDEIIGVGGAHHAGFCIWQVWASLALVPRGDWPMLLDCARAAIDQLPSFGGTKRLIARVRDDFPAAERTLERLGFIRSGEAAGWPGYRLMTGGA